MQQSARVNAALAAKHQRLYLFGHPSVLPPNLSPNPSQSPAPYSYYHSAQSVISDDEMVWQDNPNPKSASTYTRPAKLKFHTDGANASKAIMAIGAPYDGSASTSKGRRLGLGLGFESGVGLGSESEYMDGGEGKEEERAPPVELGLGTRFMSRAGTGVGYAGAGASASLPTLTSIWVRGWHDKHHRDYWRHKVTGAVVWEPPSEHSFLHERDALRMLGMAQVSNSGTTTYDNCRLRQAILSANLPTSPLCAPAGIATHRRNGDQRAGTWAQPQHLAWPQGRGRGSGSGV